MQKRQISKRMSRIKAKQRKKQWKCSCLEPFVPGEPVHADLRIFDLKISALCGEYLNIGTLNGRRAGQPVGKSGTLFQGIYGNPRCLVQAALKSAAASDDGRLGQTSGCSAGRRSVFEGDSPNSMR